MKQNKCRGTVPNDGLGVQWLCGEQSCVESLTYCKLLDVLQHIVTDGGVIKHSSTVKSHHDQYLQCGSIIIISISILEGNTCIRLQVIMGIDHQYTGE